MISVAEHAEGCIIRVWAQPRARRQGIVGEREGALKVAVTAPAQEGRANDALEDVLKRALGLKGAQLQLLRGATGRDKRFLVRLPRQDLEARLAALSANP